MCAPVIVSDDVPAPPSPPFNVLPPPPPVPPVPVLVAVNAPDRVAFVVTSLKVRLDDPAPPATAGRAAASAADTAGRGLIKFQIAAAGAAGNGIGQRACCTRSASRAARAVAARTANLNHDGFGGIAIRLRRRPAGRTTGTAGMTCPVASTACTARRICVGHHGVETGQCDGRGGRSALRAIRTAGAGTAIAAGRGGGSRERTRMRRARVACGQFRRRFFRRPRPLHRCCFRRYRR